MKKKVYIAGKINGDDNFYAKFKEAEWRLRKEGFIVLNPAALPIGMDYEDYMHIGFAMIDVCDMVYFLEDWEESPGAKREYKYATEHERTIGLMFE